MKFSIFEIQRENIFFLHMKIFNSSNLTILKNYMCSESNTFIVNLKKKRFDFLIDDFFLSFPNSNLNKKNYQALFSRKSRRWNAWGVQIWSHLIFFLNFFLPKIYTTITSCAFLNLEDGRLLLTRRSFSGLQVHFFPCIFH